MFVLFGMAVPVHVDHFRWYAPFKCSGFVVQFGQVVGVIFFKVVDHAVLCGHEVVLVSCIDGMANGNLYGFLSCVYPNG